MGLIEQDGIDRGHASCKGIDGREHKPLRESGDCLGLGSVGTRSSGSSP